MRRTTLHRTSVAAAAAAALLLVGCGSQGGGGGTGSDSVPPSPSQTPTPTPTPPPTPSDSASQSTSPSNPPSAPSSPAGSCTPRTQLDATDNGRTVCLARGQVLRLTLDGTKDRPWKPVAAEGGAVRAANPGFVIQPGDAVAAFEGVTPGTARLTSSRPLCASRPGQVSCKGIEGWTVTVEVR
ncbi:hypothetical protein ABZX30_30585 [Streptomyces sp. NPDC004542]|uniref:hypothetical protein n=1 Tax=Streptomyces sp. NPDC004542 TaxID=3154281 RepID=UPI0033AC06C9